MRRLMYSFISLFCLAAGGHALAGADEGLVRLKESRPLMKDVDALPRLFSGARPAFIKAINATLARFDAQALRDARDCLGEKGGDYARNVAATMQGPRFLSLVAYEGFFCAGNAHPDSNMLALVFDLTTGKLVNWVKLLPGTVQIKKYSGNPERTFRFGEAISSDAIWALYRKAASIEKAGDPDCADALDEKLDFILSLDAKKNAVAVDEVGLRHAIRACGTTIYLSIDTLKSLGASKALIDALDTAHRRASQPGR